MIATATAIRLQYDAARRPEIVLTLADADLRQLNPLAEQITKGKRLSVEVKPERKHRSLDSNAYAWVLMGKLAAALRSTPDEVYLSMLRDYGVYTHVLVAPDAAERMEQTWRLCRNLGKVTVKGRTSVQLQCYYGSSTYDTAEMARLIDGIVDECKGLGIETVISPAVGGLIVGQEVARALGVRAIFADKEDGRLVLKRGFVIRPGEKVLVAEDVVTKGGRVQETIDLVRGLGGDVAGIAVIVDRSGGDAKFDVPFRSALKLSLPTFDPTECPLCKEQTPIDRPGSK